MRLKRRACLIVAAMLGCCVALACDDARAVSNTISLSSVTARVIQLPSPHFEPLLRGQAPQPAPDQKRKKRPRHRIKAPR